ncbi:MAG: hypothetical protein AAB426_00440 [Myxococcota bacterium]
MSVRFEPHVSGCSYDAPKLPPVGSPIVVPPVSVVDVPSVSAPDAPAAPLPTSFACLVPKMTPLARSEPTRAEVLGRDGETLVQIEGEKQAESVVRDHYRQLIGHRGSGQTQALDTIVAAVLSANRESRGVRTQVFALPGWHGVQRLLAQRQAGIERLGATRDLDVARIEKAARGHDLPQVSVPAERSLYRTRADDRLRDIVAKAYARQIDSLGSTAEEREQLVRNLTTAVALHNAMLLSNDGIGADSGPAGRALVRLRFQELYTHAGRYNHVLLPSFRELRKVTHEQGDAASEIEVWKEHDPAAPGTLAQLRLAQERVSTWGGADLSVRAAQPTLDPQATRVAALRLLEHAHAVDRRGRFDDAGAARFVTRELRRLGLSDDTGKLVLDVQPGESPRAALQRRFEQALARVPAEGDERHLHVALRAYLALLSERYGTADASVPFAIDQRAELAHAYEVVRADIDTSERDHDFQRRFKLMRGLSDDALLRLLIEDPEASVTAAPTRDPEARDFATPADGNLRTLAQQNDKEVSRLASEAKARPRLVEHTDEERKRVHATQEQQVYASWLRQHHADQRDPQQSHLGGPVSAWRPKSGA